MRILIGLLTILHNIFRIKNKVYAFRVILYNSTIELETEVINIRPTSFVS